MGPTSRRYLLLGGLLLLPALCAACDLTLYSSSIQHCETDFEVQMNWTDPQGWCDWTVLSSLYNDLTVCTEMLAYTLQCEWPNPEVDSLFVGVHGRWLKACPRYIVPLRDPPLFVLVPLILAPVLSTLLVTALIVWLGKRSEGML
ncbi:receptor activity-modifying protein 1-like [Acipenser oxyrinchus oxyrinchus]|uniref:Receptor activity-modifying protein 1-like n=1 Tax=Acipenser oxyrinchus oxyrinchus TaxID=40147 RepID=A0AAD8CJP6_ACIOX|nr:receptor activity-modifying protein 1-like [Acipenser oxyrinchus oxyrinchus]KAK1151357.1 receptor activity-modifying protein 1-like [Acipenser oxyrinchus oxyrinchus]